MRLDETSIAVGLLHDVIEDTLTTKETLQELFGEQVAELVDGVTKISRYAYVSKEEQQAETFRKMLLAMVSDLRVVLVKLADRLHNMRTLAVPARGEAAGRGQGDDGDLRPHRQPPRHGAHQARARGPLVPASSTPRESEELQKAVDEKMAVSRRRRASASRPRSTEKLDENEIEGEVYGRVKSMYSIWSEAAPPGHRHRPALRLPRLPHHHPHVKDCYAALGIIHQMWRPVPGRIKDYIAMPKPNFYQSLHTTVVAEKGQPFEVQIRTREMDLIAEQGIAAHWKYKEGRVGAHPDDQNFLWLRQLVEWQHDIKDPRVFLNSLKIDLYPDEVYTFTPKGDVFAFPRGATPLDFAFRIHTDVGTHCVGARVNGKLVPLRTHAQERRHRRDRDQPAPVAQPRVDQHGRDLARQAQDPALAEHGAEAPLASSWDASSSSARPSATRCTWRKLVAENALDGVLSEHGLPRLDDLYADVGYGKISARSIVERFVTDEQKEKGPAADRRASSSRPSGRSSRSRPRRRSRSRATTTC